MKEYKSMKVLNTPQAQTVQSAKVETSLRMSHSKGCYTHRNSSRQVFELMKECESMKDMNTPKKQTFQSAKPETPFRMSRSKASPRDRYRPRTGYERMKESESMNGMNSPKLLPCAKAQNPRRGADWKASHRRQNSANTSWKADTQRNSTRNGPESMKEYKPGKCATPRETALAKNVN
jgi:hypothetical protein